MTNKRVLLCFMFSITFMRYSFAQTNSDNSDFNTWASVEISYKINKKLTFSIEEQLRLKDDAKLTDQYFTEFNVAYNVLKKMEVAFGYRYINENDTKGKIQGYEKHSRFHFDASYKYKIKKRFLLRHRLRYQNKNELGLDDIPIESLRLKTSLTYNIKGWKLDPKISGELFNRLKSKDTNGGISKFRFSIETEYKLNKTGMIGVFYKIDKQVNTNTPKTDGILGLKYKYSFKNKK